MKEMTRLELMQKNETSAINVASGGFELKPLCSGTLDIETFSSADIYFGGYSPLRLERRTPCNLIFRTMTPVVNQL